MDQVTLTVAGLERSVVHENIHHDKGSLLQEQKRLTDPRYKTVFRKGQLQMLSENIRNTPGVSAIFLSLDVLSQVQLNYLQNLWGLPVFDRYR